MLLQARGRRIEGRRAASLLCERLPQLIRSVMCYHSLDSAAIERHIQCVEDQECEQGTACAGALPAAWRRLLAQVDLQRADVLCAGLRSQLRERGLTSFVANGACLPRRTGVDDTPMTKEQVCCRPHPVASAIAAFIACTKLSAFIFVLGAVIMRLPRSGSLVQLHLVLCWERSWDAFSGRTIIIAVSPAVLCRSRTWCSSNHRQNWNASLRSLMRGKVRPISQTGAFLILLHMRYVIVNLWMPLGCVPRSSVRGMGIPRGITLIVGGGFHGKSTMLEALQVGIYNKIPGDGREFVITEPGAVKVRGIMIVSASCCNTELRGCMWSGSGSSPCSPSAVAEWRHEYVRLVTLPTGLVVFCVDTGGGRKSRYFSWYVVTE